MTGHELIARLKRLGRRSGALVRYDERRGKGSHGRLWYGDRFTTIKDRRKEISVGLLHDMLRQLGLRREDIE